MVATVVVVMQRSCPSTIRAGDPLQRFSRLASYTASSSVSTAVWTAPRPAVLPGCSRLREAAQPVGNLSAQSGPARHPDAGYRPGPRAFTTRASPGTGGSGTGAAEPRSPEHHASESEASRTRADEVMPFQPFRASLPRPRAGDRRMGGLRPGSSPCLASAPEVPGTTPSRRSPWEPPAPAPDRRTVRPARRGRRDFPPAERSAEHDRISGSSPAAGPPEQNSRSMPGVCRWGRGHSSRAAASGYGFEVPRRYSALIRWASSSWSSRMTMRQADSIGVPWSTSSRARAAMRSW
ncbi:hypothetical protein ACVWXU_008689 [Streptomyces sp. TE33382]